MAGRTLGREMEGLGVQGGIHSKGGRVGTRKAEEWEEQETNPKSPFPDALCPHPSSPQVLSPSAAPTLTHNFCAYEQTEKNSHQPEPALQEQAPRSGLVTAQLESPRPPLTPCHLDL